MPRRISPATSSRASTFGATRSRRLPTARSIAAPCARNGRQVNDKAGYHIGHRLPMVLRRQGLPRPRARGAPGPSLRNRVAPVPAQPRAAEGRHGPACLHGGEVRRQGGCGPRASAAPRTCRGGRGGTEPRADDAPAEHARRAPAHPLGRPRRAADANGLGALPGLLARRARPDRCRNACRCRRRGGPRPGDGPPAARDRRRCRGYPRPRRPFPRTRRERRARLHHRQPPRPAGRAADRDLDTCHRRHRPPACRRGGPMTSGTDARRLPLPEFIVLLAMMFAMTAFSIDAMLPAMPEIAADLSPEAPNRTQLIITSFVFGMGLGTFLTGPLSDALGRRRVIVGGAVLYCIGAALAWVAPSLWLVLAARVLQGLGVAGPRVAAMALVRDLYSGRQMARIVSITMMVFVLVPAVA